MLSSFDDATQDLLTRAAEVGVHTLAVRGGPGPSMTEGDALALLSTYYRHVAREDLASRAPSDVFGAVMSHRQLALRRPQGTATVRVFTPTVEEHGWTCGHTVIEIVTDDMPFLVDSVAAELSRLGRSIHLIVHPQVVVRRDVAGALRAVQTQSSPGNRDDDTQVESWIHLEIDRESDPAGLDDVRSQLLRVLRDVREAVEDWPKMRGAALNLADQLEAAPPDLPPTEVGEAVELLRWLAADHFTFLGYREYVLEREHEGGAEPEDVLRAVPATGLGILRDDEQIAKSFSRLPREARLKARERRLLVLTKANSRATVHRPAYLDYIAVKTFSPDGEVTGERRFLGLLSSAAYTESVSRVPVLAGKVRQVLNRSGLAPDSHSGRDLLQILETYPRDELFQIEVDELLPIVGAVLHLQERRRVRCFLRRDAYGRFMSCLVYLPRDRYTTRVRERMMAILKETIGGESVDYTARVSESVLARLHFVVRVPRGAALPEVDPALVEARLVEATRSWEDDFAAALLDQCGEEESTRLLARYGQAFPEAYKEDFPATTAVADLRRLEDLRADTAEDVDAIALNLYEPLGGSPGERRLKMYRTGPAISLSKVLPHLRQMGVEVTDERPYHIQTADTTGPSTTWVYDFGLRYSFEEAEPDHVERLKELFQDALVAVWHGRVDSDGLNALVLRAGLSWRQVMVLRAYTRYLRQGALTFSQDYIEQCLLANARLAGRLVALFEARFDPRRVDRAELTDALGEDIRAGLDQVASLDHDRILRAFLAVIEATLRTNYFQTTSEGSPRPYLAVKLDPTRVPGLPQPLPAFEIWVYSPRVEGVHLRFGHVARGGLRWSDRREDFRTEILGLVKAQMVKNAVIVPVGAKGGFVVKRPPTDASGTVGREAMLAEGIACYRTFVRGLLDITDNLVGGKVVHPDQVVCHDGDDAYLVVAADKGTATFSDIANDIAAEYGFWLGDAFASGGSVGYDHKAMGITARGAWASVRYHFREMGRDTQTEDFTVVGIGDMSGDVFGNGMLLSPHIRLVAAFDHRHVFLDPDPDPAVSFTERQRLFELPRSSWADYDPAKISAGGGVYPRTAKSIPITPQVRARLDIPAGVTSMTPAELMRAVLTAPVDLLWNGGIGTYVKASDESQAEAGDKANDAIRVNGNQLRARVVGEGGNLGLTQRGRIEAARNGVRLNTDAIDNSAGVDTSDHEVNLKILLNRVVADGDLTVKQRDALLRSMTDEVARLVLVDNDEQNVLLGLSRFRAASMVPVHRRLLRHLERRGVLDRELEYLPSEAEIDNRIAAGAGLTSPEFAVLSAWVKIALYNELLASDLPDRPWFARALTGYFPEPVRERFGDRLADHPLRREIISTRIVNDMVNRAGFTFAFRAWEETAAGAAEVARAYTAAREVFDLEGYWTAVEALDNQVSTDVQAVLFLEAHRLLDRAVRWFLQTRRGELDVAAQVERYADGVRQLAPTVPDLLRGAERERFDRRAGELRGQGVPAELAARAAALLDIFSLLDVVEIAATTKQPADEVADLYFALSERFDVDRMLMRITALPRGDRWQALARSALRYDLYLALAGLTTDVLVSTGPGPVEERIGVWERGAGETLTRARATLGEILAADTSDLATMSVALRTIRTLRPATGG